MYRMALALVSSEVLLQRFNRLACRKDEQFNLAALSFELHFFHLRQFAIRSGADHETPRFPGYLLPQR